MSRDSNIAALLSSIEKQIAARQGIQPLIEVLDATKNDLCRAIRKRTDSETAARALTLKILNLRLARHHFAARTPALLSRPYGIEIDPINNCNLACPGCVHSSAVRDRGLFEWNSGMLTEACFSAFLDRYGPFAIQATLCNYGEPLLNPATPKFIRLAKSYLMTTTLSTNMTAKRFDAEAYAGSGLDFMTISLDGATQAVYERFRKKGDLELALTNVRSLVEAKRRLGTRTPVISWQFLAFEHNIHEVETAAELARKLGVDQFTIATPFDVSWDDPAIRPADIAPATRAFHWDAEGIKAANWNPFPRELSAAAIDREYETTWSERLERQPPEIRRDIEREHSQAKHVCHWLYKNMVMDATGRVIPCCAAPRPDADLVFAQFGGNGAEAFNSEKYRLARLSFADKEEFAQARGGSLLDRDPHCVTCDWYGDQAAAQIDSAQVSSYFRGAADGLFGDQSIGRLAGW